MKLIAHRGNLRGPNSEKENHPDYCRDALKAGFDLEVDVWYVDKKLYTGHDKPTYGPVKYDFFLNKKIWIHAKNGDAFDLFRIDYEQTYLAYTKIGYLPVVVLFGHIPTRHYIVAVYAYCQNWVGWVRFMIATQFVRTTFTTSENILS